MDKIITFKSYLDLTKAELAKTKLDNEGIPCFLSDVYINSLYPGASIFTGGVRLNIFEKDYQRVFETLIEEFELDTSALDKSVKCPDCASANIENMAINPFETFTNLFGVFLATFPFFRAPRQFSCRNCGRQFTSID